MKKALIILPSLKKGDGTASAIMNYYDIVTRGGWHLDFMILEPSESEWANKIKGDGNRVMVLPNKNKYTREVTSEVTKIVRDGHYDLLHVNIPGHIAYTALHEAQHSGVRTRIFHAHNPKNILSMKAYVSTLIYDFLVFQQANRFIACSASAGRDRFNTKSFEILKNSIDTDKFAFSQEARMAIRKDLGIDKRFVIGVVGRFTAQKNSDFLIDIFIKIHKEREDAFLLWVGEGEEMEKCRHQLHKEQLDSDFAFVGRKSDVEQWYSAMDVFLLPSRFEGLGIAFLEAQCSGLHCFGSDKVPTDTEVTPLMHRLSLKDSSRVWAKRVLGITTQTGTKRRTDMRLYFAKAGYTHESTQCRMLELYEKWYKEGYED